LRFVPPSVSSVALPTLFTLKCHSHRLQYARAIKMDVSGALIPRIGRHAVSYTSLFRVVSVEEHDGIFKPRARKNLMASQCFSFSSCLERIPS
jgi:hypothetical protein